MKTNMTKGETEPRMSRILWATDFSEESHYCLPYMKFLSETIETKNYGLYVIPRVSDWVFETAFSTDGDLADTIAKNRQKSIETIRDAGKNAGLSIEAIVLEGIASQELLTFSRENEIDIIMAGRRGMSEIEHILIGSTTSRLIRNSQVPVFVIPKENRDGKVEKILCPIDFNELSLWELEYAICMARQLQAKLYVVHISEFFNFKVPMFKRDKLISKINEKIMDTAAQHDYNIENIIYDEGEPGHKIIEIANKIEADVITMATHQRSGFEKLFLGSITEKVLMYSDIPVLVLPPRILEMETDSNDEYAQDEEDEIIDESDLDDELDGQA